MKKLTEQERWDAQLLRDQEELGAEKLVQVLSGERRRYWTCEGSVRGWCGVHHRTLDAAEKCCERDHRSCARLSSGLTRAYSDRSPVEHNETKG